MKFGRVVSSVAALVVSAVPLSAQSTSTVTGTEVHSLLVRHGDGDDDHLTVAVRTFGQPASPGGWTWMEVWVSNTDDRPHELDFQVTGGRGSVATVQGALRVRLEPDAAFRRVLPLMGIYQPTWVVAELDGQRRQAARQRVADPCRPGLSALRIGDAEASAAWSGFYEQATNGLRLGTVGVWRNGARVSVDRPLLRSFADAEADEVPRDWRFLTGYDFVVVDAGTGPDAALQQTLLDYVRAGGRLVVVEPNRFDASSAIGSLCASGEAEHRGTLGFGRWLAVGAPSDDRSVVRLRRFLDPGTKASPFHARFVPSPSETLEPAAGLTPLLLADGPPGIAGVGEVSRPLFFVLLMAFAFVVGPVNYFVWQRRRRLSMLLMTVPLAGFGFTVVLLGWGLLADGLGIHGARATLTVLDQREHVAVTWADERLYAGLTPARVLPSSGTWLGCAQLFDSENRPWGGDAASQRLSMVFGDPLQFGGDLVPARTMTDLRIASVRPERARLRFEREGHDRVKLSDSEALDVMEAEDGAMILFRDFDGRYFAGGREQRLIEVVVPPKQLVDAIRGPFPKRTGPFHRLLEDLLPGSYVAWTSACPSHDSLDLDVAWRIRHDVVFGRLAKEDVVDGS